MSHRADDNKASWTEGWGEGWNAGWAEGRKEGWNAGWAEGRKEGWNAGWAEGRKEGLRQGIELKAPTVLGAIDGLIPYEELLKGFTVRLDVNGFTEHELVSIHIPTQPPSPDELIGNLIVTRGDIDAGFLFHGFNEDDVRHLAGKSIDVYFKRMSYFPPPESPRSRYLVQAPPARLAGHGAR